MRRGDCLKITEDMFGYTRTVTGIFFKIYDEILYLDVGKKEQEEIVIKDIVSLETITSDVELTKHNPSKIGVPR